MQKHTITSLLQHHGQAEEIDIVECQGCQREGKPKRTDRGRSERSFEFHNDIIIFRINRPPGQGGGLSMRKDPVVPEMVLEFGDVFYDLVAVVEHDGVNRHYEAVIRSENGWQRRLPLADFQLPLLQKKDLLERPTGHGGLWE